VGRRSGGASPLTPKHSCKLKQHASGHDNDIAFACALARVRLPVWLTPQGIRRTEQQNTGAECRVRAGLRPRTPGAPSARAGV
jgi:hypothetical protein